MMNTNLYCLGLTCSAILFAIGSIAMISSYFNYLYISSEYETNICIVNNTRVVLVSDDGIYQGQIYLIGKYKGSSLLEWVLVYVGNNITSIRKDLTINYPIGEPVVCYVSKNEIILTLHTEYVVLISAGIIMGIAILITLGLGVVKCIQNRKRDGYVDLDRSKKKPNRGTNTTTENRNSTDMDSLSAYMSGRMDSHDTGV